VGKKNCKLALEEELALEILLES
jgi:hypothetical protein